MTPKIRIVSKKSTGTIWSSLLMMYRGIFASRGPHRSRYGPLLSAKTYWLIFASPSQRKPSNAGVKSTAFFFASVSFIW